MMKHVPVLAQSVLRAFESSPVKGSTYVDLTLGLGGHACLVATSLQPQRVIGFDRDQSMLEMGGKCLKERITEANLNVQVDLIHANYSEAKPRLDALGVKAGAILMDLGVASPHFDDPERGMSFRMDAPLDMRLDRSQDITAASFINSCTESELGRVFRDYGEERHWRAAARVIVTYRHKTAINRTSELVKILEPVLGPRKGRIHPATKIFQALRIAVNDELNHLEKAIPDVIQLLAPGGRLGIISFHSLEDRIVKQAFAKALEGGVASAITKNPAEATKEEIGQNPRSRSAKFRVLTKA